MTCKDCLHPMICFGPEGVDEKSITYCADAKKCASFEPKYTPCALFPLHTSIYDSYYGKPRRWIIESIGVQLRKGVLLYSNGYKLCIAQRYTATRYPYI